MIAYDVENSVAVLFTYAVFCYCTSGEILPPYDYLCDRISQVYVETFKNLIQKHASGNRIL